jgi:hypothetical protein
MAIFKEITPNDIKTARSFLNQLIDITEEDISGSVTRQTYQPFVTGGVGPGVTSSLFQTVYDQDFSLQTANAIMDLTVGLYFSGSTVQDIKSGEDSAGKLLFPSTSLMMREKIDIYKQHALLLLGGVNNQFSAPFGDDSSDNLIGEALFINLKRLFSRDGIKRETFAMRFFQTSSIAGSGPPSDHGKATTNNLNTTSENGSAIFTDAGAAANQEVSFGGKVSNIVDSSNTNRTVGLLFNDQGIIVYDLNKIISGTEFVTGVIDGMSPAAIISGSTTKAAAGQTLIGDQAAGGNPNAKFIPDFLTSASIDNIIDHIASTRFSSGTNTAITFQNQTIINSTLVFARGTADEYNYSSNPTFVDNENRIVVIDEGQEDVQQTFTFITSVGLYDANNNLLAVAKLSRPVEKNPEKDITFRVRLDF